MRYILIFFTLAAALFGVFKDLLPVDWRRRTLPIIVGIVVLSSITQVWLAWNEEWSARYLRETGVLRSRYKSTEEYPVLQQCASGLKYTGDPTKPVIDFGGEGIFIRIQDGEAKLSMVVRDPNGIVRAMIRDNVWFVPKSSGVLDRNFNEDALEVIGPTRKIVLQVQVLGERVRLAGTTYSREDGGERTFGPFLNKCDNMGETMFKYPSAEFPGKMNRAAAQPLGGPLLSRDTRPL